MTNTKGQGRSRRAIPRKSAITDHHDYSVKCSVLSPEELEKYRNGSNGGKKMEDVLTVGKFKALIAKGHTKEEIAKMRGISSYHLSAFMRNAGLSGKKRKRKSKWGEHV